MQFSFLRANDWGTGFIGGVTFEASSALSNWTLAFDATFTIDAIWDAELVSQGDGRILLRAGAWNNQVAAGGQVSFGFVATSGGPVEDPSGWSLSGGQEAPPLQPVGPPVISVADSLATEGDGFALFTVSLSHAATAPVAIDYATASGTARSGQDFTAAIGSLIFAPGETSRVIAVPLIDDSLIEATERFTLTLRDPSGATLGDAIAEAAISDNDGPRVSVLSTAVTEGNSGATTLLFTFSLSAVSDKNVVVSWATEDGTAKAGEDYLAGSGTVTILAGLTSRTVAVKVLGDRVIESDETVLLNLSNPVRATLGEAQAIGTIRNDDQPRLVIADAPAITEGDPAGAPFGVLSTRGSQIIDARGDAVRLAAVNWFGMESDRFAPDGLHLRNWQEMMQQMADLGFNAIRLPFSGESILRGGTPTQIDYALNPDLAGLTPVQIIDRIVDHAGTLGMRIILDHHRSSAGAGPNANGLWYGDGYTTVDWVRMWQGLAERYLGNPTVIGADLQNEPHGASWKAWAHAAEIAGNAIHKVNPDWLILVEGVAAVNGEHYWWGGNLSGAADRPVVLNLPGKLVYSPHDYPNSIFPQPFFHAADFPDNLPALFDRMWGYLAREEIAPVLVGEIGSRLLDWRDQAWMEKIVAYLSGDTDADGVKDQPGPGISYAWWSWNPNSGDTGGILADDWTTPIAEKLLALDPILPDPIGAPNQALFAVRLTAPSPEPVSVAWRTVAGTADETDFIAAAGILDFAPGETSKTIAVTLLADDRPERTEWFKVELSAPVGANIADGNGFARITDDDWVI